MQHMVHKIVNSQSSSIDTGFLVAFKLMEVFIEDVFNLTLHKALLSKLVGIHQNCFMHLLYSNTNIRKVQCEKYNNQTALFLAHCFKFRTILF